MPDNINNDYNELAKLIYPSIEASGNVYYGQTRKLAIDELFNINDGGFESNIKTIRRQTDSNEDGFEYISYFCWKFGPLNGRIRIVPCANDNFIFKFANFPELEKIYNLDDTYITNDSTDPIVGTLFVRYKILLNDNTVEHILNSGTFNSYEKLISLDTDEVKVYITDNCDPTNVDNRDIDDRNIFVKRESDVYYLFVKLCNCADIEKPDLDIFNPEIPFCIENTGDVPVEVGLYNSGKNVARSNCQISYDLKTWSNYTLVLTNDSTNANIDKITLQNRGDRVYIKADKINKGTVFPIPHTRIVILNQSNNAKIRARGNIASLNYGSNNLYKTNYLKLPSDDKYYYTHMFQDCESLVQAPELPATALNDHCYSYMFSGCTNLTQAPKLPAARLQIGSYSYMFENCTSLTQAPELQSTALNEICYTSMFENCTSLTQAPELPATILSDGCYMSMFFGCKSLTKAPELPATELVGRCYREMFYGCSSLNIIKCLATDALASICTEKWLTSVSSTGDFYTPSATIWETNSTSGIPTGWTRHDI